MKKLFLFLGVLIAVNSLAQYSQWTYGSPATFTTQDARNGVVLRYGAHSGHIMAGVSNDGTGKSIYVVKNDLSGYSTSLPYFNKQIHITETSGEPMSVQDVKVVELQNGTGYSLAGVATTSGGTYVVFYLKLDVTGNMMAGPCLYYAGMANYYMDFGNIRENAAGTALYITGHVNYGPGFTQGSFFILKVNQPGSIIWANSYAIYTTTSFPYALANDIVEDNAGTELAITGIFHTGFGPLNIFDAFFTRIYTNTGSPVTYGVKVFGATGNNDQFLAMTPSVSDPWGNSRYLVAGMTDKTGNLDSWVLLLDQVGSTIWTTQTDDGVADNAVGGIIERQNTFGALEYYAVGTTRGGSFGNLDVHLLEGNVNTGMTLDHHVYGGSEDDFCSAIDFENGGTGRGLAMFGATESFNTYGVPEMYFIKSYFNGEVGCNVQRKAFSSIPGPDFREIYDMSIVDNYTQEPILFDMSDLDENNLCLDDDLPSGDNSFIAPENNHSLAGSISNTNTKAMKILPNPAEQGTASLQLQLTIPKGRKVEVVIADMLGRQYMNQKFEVQNGGSQMLQVDIAKAGLAPGVYIMRINGLDQPISQALIIK